MPRITVGDVEGVIRKVEGFKVCVRNPDNSDTRSNMEVKKENDYTISSGNHNTEYVILGEGNNMWCPPEQTG